FKSGVTGELQQIIDKALTKDPSLRYQHADGMLSDLKRLHLAKGARRSRLSVAMLGALPVVVILAAAIVYTQFIAQSETEPVGPKRVAVLPFENLGDPEKEYFASGMTEEITTRLAKVSGLAVIPRGTSARYGNTDKTMQEIGHELSADYIVDGTIRWQESADGQPRIRVGVHLINVKADAAVWSETYDTVITEVFAVQSEIAENVSEQMGIKLDVIERRKVWERYTSSQEAYDFYLQGNEYIGRSSGFGPIRDFQLAAEMYHKAIALDSSFVVAIRRLSYTYSRIWGRGDHSDSIKTGAMEMAHRAFELDHDTSAHNRTLASYYYFIERDMKRALEHLNEAYEDDLNSTYYLSQSHTYLRGMGDWEEAYRRQKILQERQPNGAFEAYDLGQDCLFTRRYEEAEVYLDKTIELRPDFYGAYHRKVLLYLNWQGDIEKARDVIRRSRGKVDSTRWRSIEQWLDIKEGKFQLALSRITIPPYDSLNYYFNRAPIHKYMNEVDVMRAYYDSAYVHLERFLNENPENATAHAYMGIVYAGLGRIEEAIREGKKAIELAPLEKDAMNNFRYLDYLLGIYILVQEKEEALATLERMLTIQNYIGLAQVFIDPDYAPMLDYPGFDRIVEKYGNEYARELWQEHLSKAN
ncbi:MAG: hypothetical protein JSU65_13495, partial [Candidatus Zixiibacteriota bacterium]